MGFDSLFKICSLKWTLNQSLSQVKQIRTSGFPLEFKISSVLMAEPVKAKRKIDPAIIKAREERKRKKVEKMIRKRLRLDRQLKPVLENEIPECLMSSSKERERNIQVSDEVYENRIKLLKQWSQVKLQIGKSDIMLINRLKAAQEIALNELRLESEELYQAAVKIDHRLIPFTYTGPTETPHHENYPVPDGEYIDISKKWN